MVLYLGVLCSGAAAEAPPAPGCCQPKYTGAEADAIAPSHFLATSAAPPSTSNPIGATAVIDGVVGAVITAASLRPIGTAAVRGATVDLCKPPSANGAAAEAIFCAARTLSTDVIPTTPTPAFGVASFCARGDNPSSRYAAAAGAFKGTNSNSTAFPATGAAAAAAVPEPTAAPEAGAGAGAKNGLFAGLVPFVPDPCFRARFVLFCSFPSALAGGPLFSTFARTGVEETVSVLVTPLAIKSPLVVTLSVATETSAFGTSAFDAIGEDLVGSFLLAFPFPLLETDFVFFSASFDAPCFLLFPVLGPPAC